MNPEAPKEHLDRGEGPDPSAGRGLDRPVRLPPVSSRSAESAASPVVPDGATPGALEGGKPDADQKQAIIDTMSNAITKKLMDLTRRRLAEDVRLAWQEANAQHGPGSSFIRARIIVADVYDRGAPIPTVSASPDQNRFLKDVVSLVAEVAAQLDVILE